MKRKISPPFLRRARVDQIPGHFIGGSILLSKGGSVQVSVKDFYLILYLDYKIREGERIRIERKQLSFW